MLQSPILRRHAVTENPDLEKFNLKFQTYKASAVLEKTKFQDNRKGYGGNWQPMPKICQELYEQHGMCQCYS